MELRLLYYKLRGLAESDPDGEFEDTWDDYVSKNLDYADREGNLERNFTRTTMSTGPFSSANLVALHATTIKALQAVGMYWAGQGEYQQAYDDGYLVANDMCSALQRILRDEEYITDMAVPSMRAAAEMFESAAEEDSSNAISHWENAKDAYERMEEQFKTIRSLVKQDGARIEAASCSIAMARLYKGAGDENAMRDNLRDARDVLERQVREFEDSAEDENPPLPGWLTEEKATALAAAYNGLGYAAQVEGEYSQSLVQYARATALFSADEEERADALYGSAQTAIMKAKESEVTGYYIGVAERYYEELSSTLAETKAGLKSEELRLAIAELKEE